MQVIVPTLDGPVVMLVDDDWAYSGYLRIGSHGYCWMSVEGCQVLVHRWLLNLKVGDPRVGDHINHDILNNCRSNLRAVHPTVSNLNRRLPVRDLPPYVYRNPHGNFYVRIKRHRVNVNHGTYKSLEAASIVARRLIDEFSPIDTPSWVAAWKEKQESVQ